MKRVTSFILQQTSNDLNNDWPSASNALGQSILILLFILLILFFTYRYLKKGNKYIQGNKNQNLEKIETLQVAYQNYVQIIRVGEKYILIGINKDNITFLTELDEIIKPEENKELIKNFENKFESYFNKLVKKENTENTENTKDKEDKVS